MKVLLRVVAAGTATSLRSSTAPIPIDTSVLSKLKSTTVLSVVRPLGFPPEALSCMVRAVTSVEAAMTGSEKVRISLLSPRFSE